MEATIEKQQKSRHRVIQNESQSYIGETEPITKDEDTNLSTVKPFIRANTIEVTLDEIKAGHIIPVYIKDNEPVISQLDFIETTKELVQDIFRGETILRPSIRVSHPIKGRIPEARDKPAIELLEHEKTLYYERLAFVIELPSICEQISGNNLSLCVGGVKSYNLDNLYQKKGADEHFKVFIGFQNSVCTNLCVWTNGYMGDLKVKNLGHLKACIRSLFESYNASFQLQQMSKLPEFSLSEQQFAHMVGKCRMYNHLPHDLKNKIPPMALGDTQLSIICKDYYKDNSFCRNGTGEINLWNLYNLFTGANKSTYIDNFLDRSVNAYSFVDQIRFALQNKTDNWFLN